MLFTMKYTIQQYLLGNHIPGHPKLQMYCDETEYMFEYNDRGTRYIDGSMSPNFLLKRSVSCFYWLGQTIPKLQTVSFRDAEERLY